VLCRFRPPRGAGRSATAALAWALSALRPVSQDRSVGRRLRRAR
jgi:hypothetical protein